MIGRKVTADFIESGPVDISSLTTGLYTIQFRFQDGSMMNYRFMKE
jgi:hypothetical protein